MTKYKGRRVMAADDMEIKQEADVILFEAEDVAEVIAEVTGEDVQVETSDSEVKFVVGEDEFVVEPDGTEEVVESARRVRCERRMDKVKECDDVRSSRRDASVRANRRVSGNRVAANRSVVRSSSARRTVRRTAR